jgi:hypothetical protein
MSPVEAWKWIDETMVKSFPVGIIKDSAGEKQDAH